MEVLSGEMTVF